MKIYKLNTSRWHITRIMFLLAGIVVMISLLFTFNTGNNSYLLIALFVGIMQIIFALTGYCPSGIILDKLGFPRE